MIRLRESGGRVLFAVRVIPRAARDAVGGERDEALVIRVTAAPAEGAANAAVTRVLARALDVAPSEVRIEHGASSRAKTVSVPAAARGRLLEVMK